MAGTCPGVCKNTQGRTERGQVEMCARLGHPCGSMKRVLTLQSNLALLSMGCVASGKP